MTRPRPIGLLGCALALALGACGASGLGGLGVPEVAGRGEGEERAALEALRGDRDVAASYTTLAVVHAGRGELAAARAFAERALALDPGSVGALIVAARVATRSGQLELAALHYRDAAARDPGVKRGAAREWSSVLLALARDALERGRIDAAEGALDELEATLGEHGGERSARLDLYLGVADAWIARGLTDRARALVERARKLGADAGETEFALARIDALTGPAGDERDERLTTWANRYDAAGRWPRVARFYAEARRPSAAAAAFRRALELRPDDVALWRAFGQMAAAARLPDDAVDAFSGAAEREGRGAGPAEAARHALLGARALREDGFREAALRLYAKAGAVAPADWPTAEEHARYLLAAKEPAAALAVLKAYAAAAGEGEAAVAAADVLVEAGARAEAVELLQQAADDRAGPAALIALAGLLARGGEQQRRALERAEAAVTSRGERYDVGRAWLAARDEAGVGRAVEALRREAPDDPAAALLVAELAVARGDRAGGLAAVAALEARPHPPADDVAIARFYAELALWPQASAALDRATRAEALDTRRRALALAVELAGREPRLLGQRLERDARAWLQVVAEADREPALRRVLALTERRADLSSLRADVLDALTRLTPDDPAPWVALGEARQALGERDRARVAFERYVALATHRGRAAEAVASRYKRDNDGDAAAAFYAMIPMDEVERAEIHLIVGRHLDRVGDQGGAEAHYAALLDAAPQALGVSTGVVLAFADQLLERGRYALATRAYERLATTPSAPHAALGLLRVALRRGDEAARVEADDRYLEGRGPIASNRKRLEDLARLYESEGYLRLAAERYAQRMALDASPNLGLFVQLANLRRRLGDGVGLEAAAAALVASAPAASPQRFYESAVARLTEAGRYDAAGRLLAQGLEHRARDRRLLLLAFGNALRRGDPEAALALGIRYARSEGGGAALESPWFGVSKELLGAGYPAAAVRVLDAALTDEPGEATLFAQRGRARLAAGDREGAHADFVEAISRATALRDVLDVIEGAYREGLHGDGLLDLETRVLALAPGRSEHLVALGQASLAAGKLASARQLFARYLAENDRGQLAVAEAFRGAGYLDLALDHYQRAFEQLSPEEAPAALARVADLLAQRGEAGRLDPFVRLFVASASGPRGATVGAVAEALLTVGRPADALAWFERADREAPTPASAEQLAIVRDAMGDHDGARRDLLRYIERQGGERRGRTALAVNTIQTLAIERYLASGRFTEALDLAERASASFGDDLGQTFIRARALLIAGRTAAAVDLALSAPVNLLRAQRDALPTARNLASALEERGLVAEAIALLDHLLEAGWDRGFALARLRLMARAGRLGDAREEALAIVAESGRTSEAAVGQALAAEGVPRLAAPHLWEALAATQGPGVAAVALRLLRVEQRLGGAPGDVIPRILAGARLVREDVREQALLAGRLWLAAGEPARAAAAMAALTAVAAPGDDLWPVTSAAAAAAHEAAPLVALARQIIGQSGVRARVIAWLSRAEPRTGAAVLDVLLGSDGANVTLWLLGLGLALDLGDAERERASVEAVRRVLGDTSAAHLALARVFVDHLAPERAARELAAVASPSDPERAERAWLELRMALVAGDAAVAAARARAFVEAAPDEPAARVVAARQVLEGGGVPALALDLLEPLLDGATPPRGALEVATRAAYRAGESAEARGHLARLRAAYPTSAQLDELLAAAVRAGDAEEVRPLVAAIQVDPRFQARHIVAALGGALEGASPAVREAVAAELARVAPALPACDLSLVGAWAALAKARGDVPGGARAYEQALAACPESAGLANNLAWYRLGEGADPGAALSLARDTLTREAAAGLFEPDTESVELPGASARDTWAWALHGAGRDAEALAAADWALAATDGEGGAAGEALYHRAVILEALGRGGEARAAYRAAARRDPTARWASAAKAKLRAPPAAGPAAD